MPSDDGRGLISPSAAVLAASVCAGWLQHAVLHPLDTLKVRLQYARGGVEQQVVLRQHLAALELPPLLRQRTKTPTTPSALFRSRWSPQVDLAKLPLIVDLNDSMKLLRATPQPLRSLYAGLGSSLLAVVPSAIVYMPTYEASRFVLDQWAFVPGSLRAPIAGVVTGIACAVVRVPLTVIKARTQLEIYPSAWGGFVAATKTARVHGVTVMTRDLYSGFGATAALDVATAAVLFATLDSLRGIALATKRSAMGPGRDEILPQLTEQSNTGSSSPSSRQSNLALSVSENAMIGFIASAAATMATEPIDVIRTRLMAQAKVHDPGGSTPQGSRTPSSEKSHPGQHKQPGLVRPKEYGYRGLRHGLRVAISSEGFLALYRGLLPRLLLKSFGGSIWYSTYSAVKSALS